jgi:hypothetical protein
LGFVALAVGSVRAQLVHLSMGIDEPVLILHTNHAGGPFDHGAAFVTALDLYYDSHALIGPLDPSMNYWRARVRVPTVGIFDVVRPLQDVSAWEQGLTFSYFKSEGAIYEDFELNLVFNSTIPTEGPVPLPPFPELGSTEFATSGFFMQSGDSFFQYPDAADELGGGRILSVTAIMTPVPETANFAWAALLLTGVGIASRRTGRRIFSFAR